ncbi:hypothetical protein FB567DRAFT_558505 [Paraphoma chrysanthemicola]|uniref:Uncharacterized protein n=1 Tax=Paraphoma chrysanthemicola TaxID=798071 RepID=A0A8K0RCM7_9PLEO|nr:hypothetical protein FB567DRAFT_558505 [Paraphoma chrysanthemicola]
MSALQPQPRSYLLSIPPEIRSQIYIYILTSSLPLKGPNARKFTGETYDIHTSILRTSQQIHAEARHVFFSRNTFHITSLPHQHPSPETDDDDQGSGAFEPPLQLKDLPLVRSLQLDLVYWPRRLRTHTGSDGLGWRPLSISAERYVSSLSFVLGAVKESLVRLKFVGDVRPYMYQDVAMGEADGKDAAEDEDEGLDVKKMLTGFHVADTNSRFRSALGEVKVAEVGMRCDFLDSYFEFGVEKDVVLRSGLVYLVGQVLIARSEARMNAVLRELEVKEGDEEE